MADLRDIVAALQAQPQSEVPAMGSAIPDIGAPLVSDGGQFSAGTAVGNRIADGLARGAYGAMGSIATLPQRAIENSQYALDTGNYDPSVPVEAALLAPSGGMAGVPIRGGEAILGAGPVRRLESAVADRLRAGPAAEVDMAALKAQEEALIAERIAGMQAAMAKRQKRGTPVIDETAARAAREDALLAAEDAAANAAPTRGPVGRLDSEVMRLFRERGGQ